MLLSLLLYSLAYVCDGGYGNLPEQASMLCAISQGLWEPWRDLNCVLAGTIDLNLLRSDGLSNQGLAAGTSTK